MDTQTLTIKLAAEVADFMSKVRLAEGAVTGAADRMKSALGAVMAFGAAGFSIAAFVSIAKGSIDAAAKLNDLSIQSGMTVEALSGLASVGKFSDMGAEQIAKASNKLTKNLTTVTEDSAGAGKAIQLLGLDIKGFAAMSPDQQFMAVAKSLDGFQDGAGKSAVMMALFGKEGAAMLPFMKDLAVVGELQAKVTTEQAAAADNFQDNLTRLQSSGDAWKKELANGMIPALDLAVQAFIDVTNASGGLRDETRKLAKDGSVAQWVRNSVTAVSYVVDILQAGVNTVELIGRAFMEVGKDISAVAKATALSAIAAKNLDFNGISVAWSSAFGDIESRSQKFSVKMAELWNPKLKGEQFRNAMVEAQIRQFAALADEAENAKKQLDATGLGKPDKAGKIQIDPTIKAYADLVASIHEKINATGLEIETGGKLTDAQKLELDIKKLVEKGTITATQAQSEEIKVLLNLLGILDQKKDTDAAQLKLIEDLAAARKAELQTAMAETGGLLQQVQAQQQATEAIGLNATAVAALDAARLRSLATQKELLAADAQQREGLENLADQYKRQADLLRKLADGKEIAAAKQDQLDFWKSIESTAHSVWNDVSDNGVNAFQRIGKTIKSAVLDMLWQLVAKKWLIDVGVSMGVPGASIAQSAGGAANAMGGLGTIGSTLGAFGSGLGAGGSMIAGGGIGGWLSASTSLIGTGTAAGAMAGIGALAGPIGAVLAIASLIKSLDDSGTYHTGGLGGYSAAGGAVVGDAAKSAGLTFDLASRDYTTSGQDAAVAMAKTIAGILDQTAATFGQQAGYYAATAFADDTSKDGAWGALMLRLGDKVLLDWGKGADKWPGREFADGEAGAKEYAAAVAKDVRDYLLTQTPDWADAMLSALGDTPTLENLSAVVGQINQAANALEGMGRASQAFAGMTEAATAALVKGLGGGASAAAVLDGYYQAFYTEQERTGLATARLTEQMAALGVAMPKDHVAFRALVDTAVASGKPELAAALINLSGAFNAVTPAATSAAEAVRETAAAAAQAAEQARATGLRQLEASVAREQQIWQRQADAAASLRDEVQGVFDTLASNIRDLRSEALGPALSAAQGQAYIDRALAAVQAGAGLPDNTALADAIAAVRGGMTDAGGYANSIEREYAALRLAGDLSVLQEAAGDQLSTAERQLRAAQSQIEQLDQTLTYWRDLLGKTGEGIDATMSVAAAVDKLRALMFPDAKDAAKDLAAGKPGFGPGGFSIGPGGGSTAAGSDFGSLSRLGNTYYGALGNAIADAGYIDRFDSINAAINSMDWSDAGKAASVAALTQAAIEHDVSTREIAIAAGLNLRDIEALLPNVPRYDGGTNWVPETGLAVLHKGEAVVPVWANQQGAPYQPPAPMQDNSQVVQLLQRLVERVSALESHAATSASANTATADGITRVVQGNALVTTPAPSIA